MNELIITLGMTTAAFAAGYWWPRGSWSKRVHKWQVKTFGPVELPRAVKRFLEELEELLAEVPGGPSEKLEKECADVAITLAAVCASAGGDLAEEVEKKMTINRDRKWKVDGTGCGYHVKGDS